MMSTHSLDERTLYKSGKAPDSVPLGERRVSRRLGLARYPRGFQTEACIDLWGFKTCQPSVASFLSYFMLFRSAFLWELQHPSKRMN